MANIGNVDREFSNFPNAELISWEEKQKPEYSWRVATALFNKFKNNRTQIGYADGTYFDELRMFGRGKQTTARYKTFLSGKYNSTSSLDNESASNSEAYRKGWYNIMWDDVVSFIPTIKDQVKGHFSDMDFDLKANNIDLDSGAEEERRMMEVYVNAKWGFLFNQLRMQANIPMEEPDYIPEDMKELEDLKSEGGFKAPYIQNIEKLLLHTENISLWDRFLKDKLEEDCTDLGYIFTYPEFDEETCMVKWMYADPKNVIMQYDEDNGFRNSDYAGYLTNIKISQLRQYKDLIRKYDGSEFTEEDFKAVARLNCGKNGNPSEAEWYKFEKSTVYGSGHGYDEFNVRILKCWWKDVDTERRIEYKRSNGNRVLYDYVEPQEGVADSGDIPFKKSFGGNNYSLDVSDDMGNPIKTGINKRPDGFSVNYPRGGKVKYKAEIKLGKKEKMNNLRTRVLFHTWLIVDTDFMIKWGVMPNQARYRYSEPLLPLVGYKMPSKPLVERLVPLANMYQIAWYRFQNGLAKASQGGYAINVGLTAEPGKNTDPRKLIKMWREDQVYFYNAMPGQNMGGTNIPISHVPGNLGDVLEKELLIMDFCMRKAQEITGFSAIAMGATPTSEMAVGVTEQSIMATQKSLMPILDAIRHIKSELGKRTVAMLQTAIQNDEKAAKSYAKVIGEDGVFILKLAKSLDVQYGIDLVARPDTAMKQAILNAANLALQNHQQGLPGLTIDEHLYILEQLYGGGNIRELRMKLRRMIQKDAKKIEQQKQEMVKVQNQGLQQMEVLKGKQQQEIENKKLQGLVVSERAKSTGAIQTREHDSKKTIEEEYAKKLIEQGKNPMMPTVTP